MRIMLVVGVSLLQSIKTFVENNYKRKNLVLPLVLTGSCIIIAFVAYTFSHSDMIVFLIFLCLIPIYAVWKFDGGIPIGYALLLLAIAAGKQSLGYPLASFSYWLLLVGVCCLLIDFVRNKKQFAA
jgi:hypothetical protein